MVDDVDAADEFGAVELTCDVNVEVVVGYVVGEVGAGGVGGVEDDCTAS